MNTNYENRIRRNRIRRIKQLKRRLRFGFFTLLLIITLSISLFSIQARAEGKNTVHQYKYYKSVIVTSNDSLWNYASCNAIDDNYQKYIDEVIRMNNLKDTELKIGMNLVIPYYSSEFLG